MPKFITSILLYALWPGFVLSAMPQSVRPAQSLQTAKCSFQTQTRSIADNEAAAMKSLQLIVAAQATFQSTAGNGRYGTLKQLFKAGLIDAAVASECGSGYRFKMRIKKDDPSSFRATATPIKYEKTGLRSFLINESGLIYERDRKSAKEFRVSPTLYEGGTIAENESSAIKLLRLIFSAEATFQSTSGNGNFGTLKQLGAAGVVDSILAGGIKSGYLFKIKAEPASQESAASFEVTAVPLKYGQTGKRSFYVNETGVVLEADKQAAEADVNDAPVQP